MNNLRYKTKVESLFFKAFVCLSVISMVFALVVIGWSITSLGFVSGVSNSSYPKIIVEFDGVDGYIDISNLPVLNVSIINLSYAIANPFPITDIELPSWTGGKFFGETYLSSVQISSGRFWWYDPYAEGTGFRYARDYTEIPWRGMWYESRDGNWSFLRAFSSDEIYIDGVKAQGFVPLKEALLQWKSRILVTSHFYHPFISLN